jgi:hypothetical protein
MSVQLQWYYNYFTSLTALYWVYYVATRAPFDQASVQ